MQTTCKALKRFPRNAVALTMYLTKYTNYKPIH